jgi:hypothetical protein
MTPERNDNTPHVAEGMRLSQERDPQHAVYLCIARTPSLCGRASRHGLFSNWLDSIQIYVRHACKQTGSGGLLMHSGQWGALEGA